MMFEVVVIGSDSGGRGCVDAEWEGVGWEVVCGGDGPCSE